MVMARSRMQWVRRPVVGQVGFLMVFCLLLVTKLPKCICLLSQKKKNMVASLVFRRNYASIQYKQVHKVCSSSFLKLSVFHALFFA